MKSPMIKKIENMYSVKQTSLDTLFLNLFLMSAGTTVWCIAINLIFKAMHGISLVNYILSKF